MSSFSQNLALLTDAILEKAETKERIIVALDGRCASGKSTLAASLAERLSCTLVHMDDFFLRPEQRTPERLATAGENIDHERFFKEVLAPLAQGEGLVYRPWDCGAQAFGEPIIVEPKPITFVEGSYACHPALWDYYDLRVFLTVEPDTQISRIAERNGEEGIEAFRNKWIPLEESYFDAYRIAQRVDLLLSNE